MSDPIENAIGAEHSRQEREWEARMTKAVTPDEIERVAPFVSVSCGGEHCYCGEPAVRKVGEEIPHDDPNPNRHNLTRYICAEHYAQLMGPMGAKQVGLEAKP